MRIGIAVGALLAAAALATTASAQLQPEPVSGLAGRESVIPNEMQGRVLPPPSNTTALVTVYDNTASAPNFGFSSVDPAATWGDELFTTGAGRLSQNKFTIFNGANSAGPLLTATVGLSLYDGVTSTFLGGYTTTLNFPTGLNPGFFALVTVTALEPLVINLPASLDVIETQTVLARTGTATRLGIASLNPPTIGSSPNTMYISAADVGPAGFYTVGSPTPIPANPGYQLAYNDQIVPAKSRTWTEIKKLYR